MRKAADPVEAQEEQIRARSELHGDDGADARQQLPAGGRVIGVGDGGIERTVRLADGSLLAVDAEVHARDRNVAGLRLRVEADERRLVEPITVDVFLTCRE